MPHCIIIIHLSRIHPLSMYKINYTMINDNIVICKIIKIIYPIEICVHVDCCGMLEILKILSLYQITDIVNCYLSPYDCTDVTDIYK